MRKPDFVDEVYADKDLSLLKKLTLIIPTYNRNYYLSRCLWYHAHFPFGEIIVADSSPEEKKVVNRETVAKVREMFGANVRYLEYEPETEKYGGDNYRKWGDAVQHVETEYSQIVTDKEFLIPTTLCKCIQYLLNHSEYKIITGEYSSLKCGTTSDYIFVRECAKRLSFSITNPISRYVEALHLGWNAGLLLSLYDAVTHKEIYISFLNSDISDLRFGERYIAFIGYLYGNIGYLPSYEHSVRDVTKVIIKVESDNSESSTLRYPQMTDYDKKSIEYKKMYSACKDCILNQMTVNNAEIERDMNSIFVKHIKPIITRNALDHSNQKYDMLRRFNYLVEKYLNIGDDTNALSKTSEMQIIQDVVTKTLNYHHLDEVISDLR
ncbi:MAG: TIGR00180 family glycosyltransferase [Candidatus Methanomethylophilaceae archaeon]|jgi:glycosyltransferase domain-containing protein